MLVNFWEIVQLRAAEQAFASTNFAEGARSRSTPEWPLLLTVFPETQAATPS